MQENQLLGIFIFKGDHSQHVIEILDVGGQWTPIVFLGEFQKLHPILKHQVVHCEPFV
jgi:hypothetical protein